MSTKNHRKTDYIAPSSAHRKARQQKTSGVKEPKAPIARKEKGESCHSAAGGSLTHTKAMLLAALRVWDLKHRVGQ